MKRFLILLGLVFLLAACSNSTSEANAENNQEDNNIETEEIDQVIADDEFIKATVTKLERVSEDDIDGERYIFHLDLENKTDKKVMVQAHDVSIDGTMADDMVFLSEIIVGEKKANATMDVQNYEGDLPEMNDNIEFNLIMAEVEGLGVITENDVKIEF